MSWQKTIGRVSFINCEPLFHGLENSWKVLPAPPSWLTGHLLRRDCILAPIPAADYAKNSDKLFLVPDIAISSRGEVGSVLLFGETELEQMSSIALPSDSATSVALLKFLINHKKLSPDYFEMGPDLHTMLSKSDGCLLIGDRALESAREYPDLVQLDLGAEWKKVSGHPMVFGVFAARKDSDINSVKTAYNALVDRLVAFETDSNVRSRVIEKSCIKSSQNTERLERYFGEVINRIDSEDFNGLKEFLRNACGMVEEIEMAW